MCRSVHVHALIPHSIKFQCASRIGSRQMQAVPVTSPGPEPELPEQRELSHPDHSRATDLSYGVSRRVRKRWDSRGSRLIRVKQRHSEHATAVSREEYGQILLHNRRRSSPFGIARQEIRPLSAVWAPWTTTSAARSAVSCHRIRSRPQRRAFSDNSVPTRRENGRVQSDRQFPTTPMVESKCNPTAVSAGKSRATRHDSGNDLSS